MSAMAEQSELILAGMAPEFVMARAQYTRPEIANHPLMQKFGRMAASALLLAGIAGGLRRDAPLTCGQRTFGEITNRGGPGESLIGSTPLNVATYNIAGGEAGIDAITNVIPQSADIVMLQEVYGKDTAALAKSLGMSILFGAATTFDGDTFGNAILTNLPVVEGPKVIPLGSYGSHENRALLTTVVRQDTYDVVLGVMHLANKGAGIFGDPNSSEREMQMTKAIQYLRQTYPSDAIILGGDINQDHLLGDVFTDTFGELGLGGLSTFPVDGMDQRDDGIWTRTPGALHFTAVGLEVFGAYSIDGANMSASDHCGTLVSLQL